MKSLSTTRSNQILALLAVDPAHVSPGSGGPAMGGECVRPRVWGVPAAGWACHSACSAVVV
jgi:hypothetical protein